MMKTGERAFNPRKAFNVRHGCTRSEDRLPERLLREVGKRERAVVQLDRMLPEYYEARGWDPITSMPTNSSTFRIWPKTFGHRRTKSLRQMFGVQSSRTLHSRCKKSSQAEGISGNETTHRGENKSYILVT
jgi:hypothetical protein